MSRLLNLRISLVCLLICSLFITGLLTITTRQSQASNNSLKHSFTPSVNEPPGETVPQAEPVDEATRAQVSESFGKLPLSFEENRGQVDSEVKYFARGQGYTLFLTSTEAVLALRQSDGVKPPTSAAGALRSHIPATPRSTRTSVVRMKLKGANSAPAVTGESEMRVKTNYIKGNDPAKWQTNVTRYERVRYTQVYPGIDMLYYGEQQQLEYDFEVAPGADARRIALEFTGVKRVKIERGTGDLVLKTEGGEVRQHKPVAYQDVGGVRREVASRYVVKGKRKVGIKVGEYDRTRPLVIDPVLSYSTCLRGMGNINYYDTGEGIAVDSSGHAYVTGYTQSPNFPTLNQYQTDQEEGADAFVTKLDMNASGEASLLYSTYLGGNQVDVGNDIAVDSSGHAYVSGRTESTDFPTFNQYQTDQGATDAFVTKLDTNASGISSLLYSSYLGGSQNDGGMSIAVDSSGHAYVTGYTHSANFPTLNQYQTDQGATDAFVTKLDTNLSGEASLLYSTYLGGILGEVGNGIAVDSSGHAYVTGYTYSIDFPMRNQYQTLNQYYTNPEYPDAFVTKLDTNLSGEASLLYSTYLGGILGEVGNGIAVDSSGHAYVTGSTASNDFPTLNQYRTYLGNVDIFVTKLDTNASGISSLLYSSYLGGSYEDAGNGIAVDSSGHAYVTGSTASNDFSTRNQYQTRQRANDAYVMKLDTNTSGNDSLLYSTYLGGSYEEVGQGIAVDSSGHAYVTGFTYSIDFPTLNEYQTKLGNHNNSDVFVTKLTDTYSIRGRLTSDGSTGIKGVAVTLSGSRSNTTITDDNGDYAFYINLEKGGNYTVTPSKGSLIFIPSEQSFTDLRVDQRQVNFTAQPAIISGVVKFGAAGLSGVTVQLTSPSQAGFTARTTTTSSTGAYSFTDVPVNSKYTITPVMTGYQFTPASKSLATLSNNHTEVNFLVKVYSITGRITREGTTTGISAVTVRVTSPTPSNFPTRTVRTSSTGVYTLTTLPAGRDYTISPVKGGFTFSPTTRSIQNLRGNIIAGASTNITGTQ